MDINDVAKFEEKELLVYVQLVMIETMHRMNEEIPRPCLKGVTPGDVFKGIAREKREINLKYLE